MKTGALILAARYAKAFDSIAKNTDDAAHNLESFEDCLGGLKEISFYLANPSISDDIKLTLISKVLPDNVAKSFLSILVKEKRFNLAWEVLRGLRNLFDERRGIKRGEVFTAQPLDEQVKTKIQTELENYFKTNLVLDFKEDPSLISGVKIKVGDFYIEDSSRSRLRELEKVLRE